MGWASQGKWKLKTENATEIQAATCYKISKIFSANIYINYEAHTHTEVFPAHGRQDHLLLLLLLLAAQGLQKAHRSVTRNKEKKPKQQQQK